MTHLITEDIDLLVQTISSLSKKSKDKENVLHVELFTPRGKSILGDEILLYDARFSSNSFETKNYIEENKNSLLPAMLI